MRLVAQALTPATAHPGLAIISPALTTPATRTGNQGTSTKTPHIAPCTDRYAAAPSGQASRPVFSASRNRPRALAVDARGAGSVLTVGVLEKHPFSSQSFVPMGRDAADVAYVVVVADEAADGGPDVQSARAYAVRGSQGVCYGAGLWHAPMAAVGETTDFAIFQYSNGVDAEDCVMVDLPSALEIIL